MGRFMSEVREARLENQGNLRWITRNDSHAWILHSDRSFCEKSVRIATIFGQDNRPYVHPSRASIRIGLAISMSDWSCIPFSHCDRPARLLGQYPIVSKCPQRSTTSSRCGPIPQFGNIHTQEVMPVVIFLAVALSESPQELRSPNITEMFGHPGWE
jgi:hypothetical protein